MLAVERLCLTTVTYLTVQAAKIPTRYLEHKKAFKEVILCIAHLMNVSQVIARLRHRVTTRANTVCSLARGNYYAKNIKLYEQETKGFWTDSWELTSEPMSIVMLCTPALAFNWGYLFRKKYYFDRFSRFATYLQ